jgi:signal transduction histidine kinase
MENKKVRRSLSFFVLIFLVFNLLVIFHVFPVGWKMDYRVVLIGNSLLFGVTYVSFLLHIKGLRNPNPHVFVRTMYGSLLVKMLICLVAVMIYAMASGGAINRNGIIACFVLYLLYTILEVRILQRLYRTPRRDAGNV